MLKPSLAFPYNLNVVFPNSLSSRAPLLFKIAFISAVAFMLPSCHSVERIDVESERDISGKWNDVDSKLTAQELTDQILGEDWLNNFAKSEKEKPVLIVGFVKNKSHEHIEAETFMKDIERSFTDKILSLI